MPGRESYGIEVHAFGSCSKAIPPHGGIDRLSPRVDAAAQTADILQTMAHEVGGGIQRLPPLVIHDHEQAAVRAISQNLAHDRLGKQNGAGDVDRLEFFT